MTNLVILASDDGGPLLMLLGLIAKCHLPIRISLLITDQRGSRAQDRAEDAGIPTLFHPFDWYVVTGRTAEDYDRDLASHIAAKQPDRVLLSGWDRPLAEPFMLLFAMRLADIAAIIDEINCE